MLKIEDLNSMQLDVFKEVGNIGAGHAATALSQLLLTKVEMTVPNVTILPLNEVSDYLGGAEETLVGVCTKVFGDIQGKIIFLFEQNDASILTNLAVDLNLSEVGAINELIQSTLLEISNIMTGAYLNALTRLTDYNLLPSVPAYACDMVGAMVNTLLADLGMVGDYAMLIKTSFIMTEQELNCHFLLIPDPGSLEVLLRALGVK